MADTVKQQLMTILDAGDPWPPWGDNWAMADWLMGWLENAYDEGFQSAASEIMAAGAARNARNPYRASEKGLI